MARKITGTMKEDARNRRRMMMTTANQTRAIRLLAVGGRGYVGVRRRDMDWGERMMDSRDKLLFLCDKSGDKKGDEVSMTGMEEECWDEDTIRGVDVPPTPIREVDEIPAGVVRGEDPSFRGWKKR